MNLVNPPRHADYFCPFCEQTTKHILNFKSFGYNSELNKQDVHALRSCTSCTGWQENVVTVMLKEDWEQLKVVKT